MTSKEAADILGVEILASKKEIDRRWKKLARKYHPDVTNNNKEKEKKFKEIRNAYEMLSSKEDWMKYAKFAMESMFDDDVK